MKMPFTEAETFYQSALKMLAETKVPFMIGGTYSIKKYTGIQRPTKDLDVFCKSGDYPKIIQIFKDKGFKVTAHDSRWIAKVYKDKHYIDLIYGTPSGMWQVDDTWFNKAPTSLIFGVRVKIIPPEEMILARIYVQSRDRYDGADINHLILKQGNKLDWKRILVMMESHWELLFSQIMNFRFVYPSERAIIPKWLMKELIQRVDHQLELPVPKDKTSRGPLLSHDQYQIDITKWGFHTITLNLNGQKTY
jgi:hypothetical protein